MSLPICLVLIWCLLRPQVASQRICADSQVDAIAFQDRSRTYFVVIGNYYWYFKEEEALREDEGKRLPDEFKQVTAAFFFNTFKLCDTSVDSRVGVEIGEMDIWLLGPPDANGDIKMMAFDTRHGMFRTKSKTNLARDQCFQKLRIKWDQPLNASFAIDSTIYMVQGENYTAVDCSNVCKKAKNCENQDCFGEPRGPWSASDLQITNGINAMISRGNKELVKFDSTSFSVLKIISGTNDGKRLKTQPTGEKGMTLADYFKVKEFAENCEDKELNTAEVKTEEPDATQNSELEQGNAEDTNPNSPGSGSWMWLIIAVIVVIVIVIAISLFFLTKGGASRPSPAPPSAQPKVASKVVPPAPKSASKRSTKK